MAEVKRKATEKKKPEAVEITAEVNLLFDFYGQMLTSRQQEVISLYHVENFSLAEIAEELGISRQAVHDTLKKAEKALRSYEERLKLAGRLEESRNVIEMTDETIDELMQICSGDKAVMERLQKIRKAIDSLEE